MSLPYAETLADANNCIPGSKINSVFERRSLAEMVNKQPDKLCAASEFERGCRRCCDTCPALRFTRLDHAFSAPRSIKTTIAVLFAITFLSIVLNRHDFEVRRFFGFQIQAQFLEVHVSCSPSSCLQEPQTQDSYVSPKINDAVSHFAYADANFNHSERQRGKTNEFRSISSPMPWSIKDPSNEARIVEGWQNVQRSEDVVNSSSGDDADALKKQNSHAPGGIAQEGWRTLEKWDDAASSGSRDDAEALKDQQISHGDVMLAELKLRNPSLDEILEAASLPSKTVIIASLNAAWAENNTMIDMFLESFHAGNDTERLLKHLVIVAFDQKAFDRCIGVHNLCLKIETPGVDFSQEKLINSEDFLKMMWRRVKFLGTVLEKGYSFVFTDADILWLRDPFPRLKAAGLEELQADMAVASDHFNGNASDVIGNAANTGFIYARANNRTISAYRYWYEARGRYPRKKEQNVFNSIKLQRGFRAISLRLRILDNRFFAAFCDIRKSDMENVVTMHGACCRGLNAKLHDLRTVLDGWKLYLERRAENSGIPSGRFNRPWACPRSWPRVQPSNQTAD